MLTLMELNRSNARVRLVHLDAEPKAQARLITSESPSYRMGDRVLVEVSRGGEWRRGHVDHRAPSDAGGVIMVTSER